MARHLILKGYVMNQSAFFLLATGLLIGGVTSAHAQCTYTIEGNVKVAHQISELSGESPLENIQVKVSAQSKTIVGWGWFTAWDTVRTDASGFFSVTRSKSCNKRRFRVKVKFDDENLEIRHETSTSSLTKVKWYKVYEDSSEVFRDSVTVNLGDLVFDSVGDHDLDAFEPRRHADIWVLYHMAFDALDDLDRGFESKVKIKYPHDGVAADEPETSYANPITHVIYIVKNLSGDAGDDTDTLLHELMHIWMYQHSRGESALAGYLLTHLNRGTHDIVDQEYVAFHEGFAEYAAQFLLETLFGTEQTRPLSKAGLINQGLDTLDLVQFKDDGWQTVFRTLALDDLSTWNFSTASTRAEPRGIMIAKTCDDVTKLGFQRLTRIFDEDASAGYTNDIHRNAMNFDDFFERAEDIVSPYDANDTDVYMQTLDPESDFEPYNDICEPLVLPFNPFPWGP